MSTSVPAAGGSEAKSALVAGDDLRRVDSIVSAFRRGGFSVRCVLGAAAMTGMRLVRETPFNLVVVVLPSSAAGDLLDAVRGEASLCRQATVLLVLAPDGAPAPPGAGGAAGPEQAWAFAAKSHRVLPAECPPEELLGVAEALLHPAPRMAVRAAVRILIAGGTEPLFVKVEDLSATGILLTAGEAVPVGSLFEFEIVIRSLAEPIWGHAQVVRYAGSRGPAEHTVAARFLSFEGEGARLLEMLIAQERAAADAKQWMAPDTSPAAPPALDLSAVGAVEIRDAEDLAQRKQELAELSRFLDGLLRQGLGHRVRNADWYVTAAKLGVESLGAFADVVAAVKGRVRSGEVVRHLADMEEVRRGLGEFVLPTQNVAERVQILLRIRQALERLLRALALTGPPGDSDVGGSRPRGLVAEVVHDIQKLVRSRQVFTRVPALIEELQHPKYLVSRAALRRRAGEIQLEYSPFSSELGLKDEERLLTRQGRQETATAAAREVRRLDQWLAAIHQSIYGGKLQKRSTGNLEEDFSEPKVVPALVETLSGGTESLVRTYGAYRHALELTRTDPRLLDRVAELAESVAVAEGRGADPRS